MFLREPSCMLARMFASEENSMMPSTRDDEGAFLIDRSPKYFEPLLNYLRTGRLILDPNVNPEGVLEEARYFGMDAILPELERLSASHVMTGREGRPLTRRDVVEVLIGTSTGHKTDTELRFQGVNLEGADLRRLDLRHVNFKYANLRAADLSGANLSWSLLERADLSHCRLDGAQLLGVKMNCANLEAASLKGSNFEDPAGSRANLEGVNLKGANLEGSIMAGIRENKIHDQPIIMLSNQGINLRVATLKNVNMKNCDLRMSVLAGADLEHCNLSGSDLHEANLRGANLKDATLELMLTPLHMSQTV